MKKTLLLVLFLTTLFLSGYKKDKALVFFSHSPISMDSFTIDKTSVSFQEGQRIHFVLFNPKPFTSSILRVQILKIDRKAPAYGVSISQAKDIEIDQNENYVTDYFCLHQEGYYYLRIFSSDKMKKPLAEADFQVDSL